MRKGLVAVIFGGKGREHEVSRMSARNVISLINEAGFTPYPVLIDRRGVWHERNTHGKVVYPIRRGGRGAIVSKDTMIIPDVALPALHGDFGEDGKIQGALDCAAIPYVGCGVTAGAVAADKILTKELASSLGIPTARAIHLTEPTPPGVAKARAEEEIGYPMFIKPSGLGSSHGCSLVSSPPEFDAAFAAASACGERILIEEYCENARELECAYLSTPTRGEIFTPPGEVSVRGVYTYGAKYSKDDRVTLHRRADVPRSVCDTVREYSRSIVRALGVRQLSRIDFFLSGGRVILNEINTMPGFTKGSLYPMMLEEYGIPQRELIAELIEGAL